MALRPKHRQRTQWVDEAPKIAVLVAIVGVLWVTLWQLHPNLLLANTLTTGGDTGAHVALPAFLKSNLLPWHLTGWYSGWYNGFPLYTYYFVLPDLVAAIVSYVLPSTIAFKFATILGSLLMPVCAYALGKCFRLKAPFPAALAVMMLPFLFDPTFTIDGGNLFSTLAGEYAFSLSLALSLLLIGLFARGVRTGKGSIVTPVLMALCLGSHMVPYLYAGAAAAVIVVLGILPDQWFRHDDTVSSEPHRALHGALPWRRSLWWGIRTGLVGLAFSAWWLLPFTSGQLYANPMGYVNDTYFVTKLFPTADRWVVALAAVAIVWGLTKMSKYVITIGASALLWAMVFRFLPQGSLWNERVIPLWYISLYLLAAWTLGATAFVIATWWRGRREAQFALLHEDDDAVPAFRVWAPGSVIAPIMLLLLSFAIVLPPLLPSVVPPSTLASVGINVGANQVSSWAAWNYSGYQGKPAYPEYKAVIDTMASVGKRYGCGRAMWEYSSTLNRFGTPMALMLLPYWTNNCIGSQEGLFFEASATVPFHFLIQAEVSETPSNPQVGLPYGPTNVALGVQHLQLLGVRYFMTSSTQVTQQANADPQLTKVASTGPWPAVGGATSPTTWSVYLIHDAPAVVGLTHLPVVVPGIDDSSTTWKNANVAWFEDPMRWDVPLAASGPRSWPIGTATTSNSPTVKNPAVITHVDVQNSSVSFNSSQIGKPVLVRESYYPRWHANGATGPYRVSPNFMVVIPTAHHVELSYGSDPTQFWGVLLTLVAIVGLVIGLIVSRRRRMRIPAEYAPIP